MVCGGWGDVFAETLGLGEQKEQGGGSISFSPVSRAVTLVYLCGMTSVSKPWDVGFVFKLLLVRTPCKGLFSRNYHCPSMLKKPDCPSL